MDILQTLYEFIKDLFLFGRSLTATRRAWRNYLDMLIKKSERIGRDWVGSRSGEVNRYLLNTLEAYVPMSLAIIDSGRLESLRVALQDQSKLVILGEPGAGKTTLTTYITLIHAGAVRDPKRWQERLTKELGDEPLLPVWIDLRDLLLDSGQNNPSREKFEERLMNAPLILLFDGLDEISDKDLRAQVTEDIAAISSQYQVLNEHSRFIVTSRRVGYDHTVLGGADFELRRLESLEPDQQERMIHNYYSLWSKAPSYIKESIARGRDPEHESQLKANELIDLLKNNSTMRRLAVSPLLLALISFQHFQGKVLPSKRHELYQLCIEQLVTRRDKGNIRKEEKDKRLDLLGEVALAMLSQPNWSSTIGQLEALFKAIGPHYRGLPHTQEFLVDAEKEWGMLSSYTPPGAKEPSYNFLNTSFQEYMAARIVNRAHVRHWPTLRDHLIDPQWWEVVLLYSAIPATVPRLYPVDEVISHMLLAKIEDKTRLWLAIGQIIANEGNHIHPESSKYHRDAVVWIGNMAQYNAEALGVFSQINPQGPEYCLGTAIDTRVTRVISRKQFVELLGNEAIKPDARQNLRDILLDGLNGEPRLSIKKRIVLAEALSQLSEPRQVLIAVRSTQSGVEPFRIMKYPVTNAEYSRFVKSTNHRPPEHWQGDHFPSEWGNHPVTHVTFDDAMQYCQWLTRITGIIHQLPTDAEWLSAALGQRTDVDFPWGNEPNTDALNCMNKYNGITPVGIFLEGESASGVSDLMGNVWEWTCSRRGGLQWLRGGAYDMPDLRPLREVVRFEDPECSDDTIGFRAVAAL